MVVGVQKCERKFKHLKVFVLLGCTDYLYILLENKSSYMGMWTKIKTRSKISKPSKENQDIKEN